MFAAEMGLGNIIDLYIPPRKNNNSSCTMQANAILPTASLVLAVVFCVLYVLVHRDPRSRDHGRLLTDSRGEVHKRPVRPDKQYSDESVAGNLVLRLNAWGKQVMGTIIRLDSIRSYEDFISNVAQMGVLRRDERVDENGALVVTLRERTWGEWLQESLRSKPQELAQKRQAVADVIAFIINKQARAPEQLVQNIRERVSRNKDITGRALKRDQDSGFFSEGPLPLKDGIVAARGTGRGLRVLGAPPASIKCDHVILRSTTALRELDRRYSDQRDRLMPDLIGNPVRGKLAIGQNLTIDGAPAGSWSCITDVAPIKNSGRLYGVKPEDLEAALSRALQGKRGAVVVDLLPDACIDINGTEHWNFALEAMAAQCRAAENEIKAAERSGESLVISFACEDVKELERMRDYYKTLQVNK